MSWIYHYSPILLLLSLLVSIELTHSSFEEYEISYQVHENRRVGYAIGTIVSDLRNIGHQLPGNSNGYGNGADNQVVLKLGKVIGDYLKLNGDNGQLVIGRKLDLEEICRKKSISEKLGIVCDHVAGKGVLKFPVNVWQNDMAELLASVKVTVTIFDVEDNTPEFRVQSIIRRVSELRLRAGQTVILESATDLDIGREFRQLQYGILSVKTGDTDVKRGDYNNDDLPRLFKLNYEAESIPRLVLQRDLDAETQSVYYIRLKVWNSQTRYANMQQLTNYPDKSILNITLIVQDSNDNPPIFMKTHYAIVVREDQVKGTIIYQLKAEDRDSTARLIYSSESSTTISNDIIVTQNGSVVIGQSGLDYEDNKQYRLSILVTDGIYEARTALEINIEDINDESPTITQNPQKLAVPENSRAHRIIGQITILDKDDTLVNGIIRCNQLTKSTGIVLLPRNTKTPSNGLIFGGSSQQYTRPSNKINYDIKTSSSFDRENISKIAVILECSDGHNLTRVIRDSGKPFRTHTSTFTVWIHVTDLNDNVPQFNQTSYTAKVLENSRPGTVVYQLNATDKDTGDNARLTYSLVNNSDYFMVDPVSGKITVSNVEVIDREKKAFHMIKIKVQDNPKISKQTLSSTTTVKISIKDENDNSPVLHLKDKSNRTSECSIKESANIGTSVCQLRWTDADEGTNGRVSFMRIWSSDMGVDVMPNGTIVVSGSLDREKKDRHCMRVRLMDHGIPKRRATTEILCISVLDVNDNPPRIIEPIGLYNNDMDLNPIRAPDIKFSLRELPGFIITKIVASDNDIGENARVIYKLDDPNDLTWQKPQNNHPSNNVDDDMDFSEVEIRNKLPSGLELNSTNGYLMLQRRLPLSAVGTYRLIVVATDSGNPPLFDKKELRLEINTDPPKPTLYNDGDPDNYGNGYYGKNKSLSPWTDKNSLLVVLILSSVSALLIITFVSAIACMIKPCCFIRNRNNGNNQQFDNGTEMSKPDLNQHDVGRNFCSNGSVNENLLLNCGGQGTLTNGSCSEISTTNLLPMNPQFVDENTGIMLSFHQPASQYVISGSGFDDNSQNTYRPTGDCGTGMLGGLPLYNIPGAGSLTLPRLAASSIHDIDVGMSNLGTVSPQNPVSSIGFDNGVSTSFGYAPSYLTTNMRNYPSVIGTSSSFGATNNSVAMTNVHDLGNAQKLSDIHSDSGRGGSDDDVCRTRYDISTTTSLLNQPKTFINSLNMSSNYSNRYPAHFSTEKVVTSFQKPVTIYDNSNDKNNTTNNGDDNNVLTEEINKLFFQNLM